MCLSSTDIQCNALSLDSIENTKKITRKKKKEMLYQKSHMASAWQGLKER
jgi:hypothetical protein